MKRVLFDHCTPKSLRRHLPGYEIRTCYEEGWAGFRNGELLAAAEAAQFEVFITADRNLRYQQNLGSRRIAIIELPTNRLALIERLVSAILEALANAAPGGYQVVPFP
jgi:hypothetical protein